MGPVRVLGWSHGNASAAGGEAVALALLDRLAHHPTPPVGWPPSWPSGSSATARRRWTGLDPADLDDGDLRGTTDDQMLLAEVLEKRGGLATGTVFPGLDRRRLGVVRAR